MGKGRKKLTPLAKKEKLRVLVIDDNMDLCNELSKMLTEAGYTLSCARIGREAIDSARGWAPHVIIVDVVLPELNGFEVVQRLSRMTETRYIPLIVLSDHPELQYELLSVFDFIPKPVDRDRLLQDLELLQSGRRRRASSHGALTGDDYITFRDFLIAHSGLHFDKKNIRLLERGILNRMQVLKIGTYEEYYQYLSLYGDSRQELQKLLQFLTIGETFFFRYMSQFQALRLQILPELARRGKDSPIRIWSAGCSTGEEPYSLAMTVMESLPDWRQRDIRIYASDINNRALRVAREGTYGPRSVRVADERHLKAFFEKTGEQFRVKDSVKSMVEFFHFNLQTGEVPCERLHDIDVIFCRNVLIYFSTPTSRQVIEKLSTALAPGGHLFLGHAENLFHLSSRYERISAEGAFYYRNKGAMEEEAPQRKKRPVRVSVRPPHVEMQGIQTLEAAQSASPSPEPSIGELFEQANVEFEAENFSSSAQFLGKVLAKDPRHVSALVLQGFIYANMDKFDEALQSCAEAVAIDDLLPDAYFLRGLVHELSQDLTQAVADYQKAILLNMDFLMPHYNVAKVYYRLGRQNEGNRELRNTLRLLEKAAPELIIPYSGGLSREVFLDLVRSDLEKAA